MPNQLISRRTLLKDGTLLLAGIAASPFWLTSLQKQVPIARIGIITDVHHADKAASGTRHYRQALRKLQIALEALKRSRVDRIVCLGDIVDDFPVRAEEEAALALVADKFRATGIPYHFVMGNHCLAAVDKAKYAELTKTAGKHESFAVAGVKLICLDACFRPDGVAYDKNNFKWNECFVPPAQVEWLEKELAQATGPCVVLTHQLLEPLPDLSVKNEASVRAVIEASKKVSVVIQGHHHKNRLTMIDKTPYAVMRSVIDGPNVTDMGYSILEVHANGSCKILGFAEQASYGLSR